MGNKAEGALTTTVHWCVHPSALHYRVYTVQLHNILSRLNGMGNIWQQWTCEHIQTAQTALGVVMKHYGTHTPNYRVNPIIIL